MLKFLMEHTANLGSENHPVPRSEASILYEERQFESPWSVDYEQQEARTRIEGGLNQVIKEPELKATRSIALGTLRVLRHDMSNEAVAEDAFSWIQELTAFFGARIAL
jgi:hypothetical protein